MDLLVCIYALSFCSVVRAGFDLWDYSVPTISSVVSGVIGAFSWVSREASSLYEGLRWVYLTQVTGE